MTAEPSTLIPVLVSVSSQFAVSVVESVPVDVHMTGEATTGAGSPADDLLRTQEPQMSAHAVENRRSAIWIPFRAAPFRRLSPHAKSKSASS